MGFICSFCEILERLRLTVSIAPLAFKIVQDTIPSCEVWKFSLSSQSYSPNGIEIISLLNSKILSPFVTFSGKSAGGYIVKVNQEEVVLVFSHSI
jgi:hypothetical protein